MAYHLLQHDREGAEMLSRALYSAVARRCTTARAAIPSPNTRCATSAPTRARDASLLCVVETPADQMMIEHTGSYKGLYFVLMGRLSPLDGIGPRRHRVSTS